MTKKEDTRIRVCFLMEPEIWHKFCEYARENRSDGSKELRKMIDIYISGWEREKRGERK